MPTLAQLEEHETVMVNFHLGVACSSQAGRIMFSSALRLGQLFAARDENFHFLFYLGDY